jgi:carboxymethylenebutenolidase
MKREWIDVSAGDGGRFKAYLAAPDGVARPGLVICSEVFGVNPHMRSVADSFAATGYATLVPDLFWRIEPGMEIPYDEAGLKKGSAILAAFDIERGVADLSASIDALRARRECSGKVGVVGFCVGGALAYLAAVRLPVESAIGYYAKGIDDYLDEADKLNCPLLLHFGGNDRFIPQDVVARIRHTLGARPGVDIHVYSGVDHGFNSEDRRAYNPEAAALAMGRTLTMLGRALTS